MKKKNMKVNGGNVAVVAEPSKFAKMKASVKKNSDKIIATGLTILVVAGAVILYLSNRNKNNNDTTNTISYTDEELKTIYIDKETYLENVKGLSEYLSEYGNKNIKPVDVNSFYYIANMDNIKPSIFKELVEEGYLPESETDIIISALGIMDDLRDTNALNAINGQNANVDYSKIFVNSRTAKVFTESQNKYNVFVETAKKSTRGEILEGTQTAIPVRDELTSIATEEDNYELGENTLGVDIQEFGTLSPAEQFIYNNIHAKTFDILAANYGIDVGGAARTKRINDISNLVVSLREEFSCMPTEEKTLTK